MMHTSSGQEIRYTATFVLPLTRDMAKEDKEINTPLQSSIQCIKDIIATHPQYTF